MSFILLGILNSQAAGAGGAAFFLSTLGDTNFEEAQAIAKDSGDNLYITGRTDEGAGGDDYIIAKYNASGEIQWQRTLGGASNEIGLGIAVDSSDNIYVAGETRSEGSAFRSVSLAKYDSTGSIQFQKILTGSEGSRARAAAIDSSDNFYIVGETAESTAGNNDLMLAKYNSSGTLQWQRLLGGANDDQGLGVAVDSSDNIYITGFENSESKIAIAKYNSSGTIQWQRSLDGTPAQSGRAIAADSSDNIYITGFAQSGSNLEVQSAKYNSSGTLLAQKKLSTTGFVLADAVAVDSGNNIFIAAETQSVGEGSDEIVLAKYNSSLVLQYQRSLGGSGDDTPFGLTIDSTDAVCIAGRTSTTGAGSFDAFVAKLPNDGSLTGTYSLGGNNIVYQTCSLTDATSSLSSSTSSLTAQSGSMTSSTSTLTDATATLTSDTIEIG